MNSSVIPKLLRRVAAALLAAALLMGTGFISALADAPADVDVSTVFRKRKTVGGMVLAAKDGEIVYSFCYGYADKRAKDPVTPDTCFKLASVSKLVTATAVMRLVDAGRLDLDENVGHLLGNPAYEAANPRFPEISLTCRHLMSHTAGIRDATGPFSSHRKLSEILNPAVNRQKSGFLKDSPPGSAYMYSNYGAGILGCVLEALTGKRLTDAVRELLFDPMGIDAAYDPSLLRHPENIVTTYKASGSPSVTRSYRLKQAYRSEINIDRDYGESYGGLWMRGEDLCRIGILLCDGGVIDGTRLLSEETVTEMLSSQTGKGGITADSPYGLNVERVTGLLPGHLLYGHQGMANGVLCSLYFDPETRFVFALVTNGCNTNMKQDRICKLSRDLFSMMWDAYAAPASI